MNKTSQLSIRPIRVLVINPNNWYNKGDTSNRLGLVKALRKEFGNNVTITLESLTPQEDSRYFKRYRTHIVESIFHISGENKFSFALRVVKQTKNALLLLLSLMIYRIFEKEIKLCRKTQAFLRNLAESDLVISSPGGFLQDYAVFSSLLPNLCLVLSAEILRKPIVIYAQSIGPFRNRLLRILCRFILNRVDIIILREEISRRYLKEAGINRPRVFVTADATFSIEPPHYNKDLLRQKLLKAFQDEVGDVMIGITVLGGYFLNRKRHDLLKRYVRSLVSCIDSIVNELNANIIFVPQVVARSEIMMMHMIKRLIENKKRVFIINEDLSPEDVMKIIGCMDILIGTRMHSNIFALIMNVPPVAIAYEHKTYGIMEMLGLENWILDINNINERELISKVRNLHKSLFEIKKNMLEAVYCARAKSLSSAKIVRAFCEASLKS